MQASWMEVRRQPPQRVRQLVPVYGQLFSQMECRRIVIDPYNKLNALQRLFPCSLLVSFTQQFEYSAIYELVKHQLRARPG